MLKVYEDKLFNNKKTSEVLKFKVEIYKFKF